MEADVICQAALSSDISFHDYLYITSSMSLPRDCAEGDKWKWKRMRNTSRYALCLVT